MNLKKYYKDLLTGNAALVAKVGNNGILSAYPQEVTLFPCVIYEDSNSSDTEFSDKVTVKGSIKEALFEVEKECNFYKMLGSYPTVLFE